MFLMASFLDHLTGFNQSIMKFWFTLTTDPLTIDNLLSLQPKGRGPEWLNRRLWFFVWRCARMHRVVQRGGLDLDAKARLVQVRHICHHQLCTGILIKVGRMDAVTEKQIIFVF